MKTLDKWIILVALFFVALTSYGYGFSNGVIMFVVLGVIFELAFWVKILGKKKSKPY